jgi:hypothetical protein
MRDRSKSKSIVFLLIGTIFSFFHLASLGISEALDRILYWPVFLPLIWFFGESVALKPVVLLNSALWGFGGAWFLEYLFNLTLRGNLKSNPRGENSQRDREC